MSSTLAFFLGCVAGIIISTAVDIFDARRKAKKKEKENESQKAEGPESSENTEI